MKAISRYAMLFVATFILAGGMLISCTQKSESEQVKEDMEALGENISDLVKNSLSAKNLVFGYFTKFTRKR